MLDDFSTLCQISSFCRVNLLLYLKEQNHGSIIALPPVVSEKLVCQEETPSEALKKEADRR